MHLLLPVAYMLSAIFEVSATPEMTFNIDPDISNTQARCGKSNSVKINIKYDEPESAGAECLKLHDYVQKNPKIDSDFIYVCSDGTPNDPWLKSGPKNAKYLFTPDPDSTALAQSGDRKLPGSLTVQDSVVGEIAVVPVEAGVYVDVPRNVHDWQFIICPNVG